MNKSDREKLAGFMFWLREAWRDLDAYDDLTRWRNDGRESAWDDAYCKLSNLFPDIVPKPDKPPS